MDTDHTPGLDPHSGESLAHQPDHSNVRALAWFGAGLAVLVAAALLAIVVLYQTYESAEVARHPRPSPLLEERRQQVRPGPALQPSDAADMQAMRVEEDQILTSYGWLDRDRGVVRIPVKRAMALMGNKDLQPQQAEE
jgi:hypothetical protein